MTKKTGSQGFTLIELLVVIAIIGILAAVVLSALNSSRVGAKNKAIMSNLANAKTDIQIYYDESGGTYGAANMGSALAASNCPAVGNTATTSALFFDNDVEKFITAAAQAGGGVVTGVAGSETVSRTVCRKQGNLWAIAITNAAGNGAICLDHTNSVKEFSGTVTVDTPNEAVNLAAANLSCK